MTDGTGQSLQADVVRALVWLAGGAVLLGVLVGFAQRQGLSVHDATSELFLPVVLVLWAVQLFTRRQGAFSATTVAGGLILGAGTLDLTVFFWEWPTANEVVVDIAMLVGVAAYLYSDII